MVLIVWIMKMTMKMTSATLKKPISLQTMKNNKSPNVRAEKRKNYILYLRTWLMSVIIIGTLKPLPRNQR